MAYSQSLREIEITVTNRAGDGVWLESSLDANGEVGFVLTSKDGSRTLTLSPDDHKAIKLAERGGRVLWAVP